MKIIEKKEIEEKWELGDVIKVWDDNKDKHYFMIARIYCQLDVDGEERRQHYGLVALNSITGVISADGVDKELYWGLCYDIASLKVNVKEAWQNVKKVKLEMKEI